LADRLDGKPAQMLEHSGPDSEPITKVVNEIVHVYETREQIEFNDQTPLLEINPSKNGGNTQRRSQDSAPRPSLSRCWRRRLQRRLGRPRANVPL